MSNKTEEKEQVYTPTELDLFTRQSNAIRTRVVNGHKSAFFDYDSMTPKTGSMKICLLITDKQVQKVLSEPQLSTETEKEIQKIRQLIITNSGNAVLKKLQHDKALEKLDYVAASEAGKLWKEYEANEISRKAMIEQLEAQKIEEVKQYIADLEEYEQSVKEFFDVSEKKKSAVMKLKELSSLAAEKGKI